MFSRPVALACITGICICIADASDKETTRVDTDAGTFIGYVLRFRAFDQEIAVKRFLGVPYADSPMGDNRFKKPKQKTKLTEPFLAMNYGPACMQQTMIAGGKRKQGKFESIQVSEDCLFLNIYTPEKATELKERLPVMIFIHGGGFVSGSPNMYAADILSVYGNVIVVTVAYRLSVWGFLSTGDETLPGNYGLWDQQMAIQWVHDNIANFGGDPELMTLIGTSAGSASVIYQGLFPGNKGLFQRIIAQSGSITCPWAFNNDPLTSTKRLGKLVGCDNHVTTKDLADCLKSKKTDELESVLNAKENGFIRFPMEFVTVIDGEFIPESPYELFHGSSNTTELYRSSLASVDLMTGITSGERLMMITPFVGIDDTESFSADRKKFETELIPEIVRVMFGRDAPAVLTSLIINEYTNWDDADNSINSRDSFIKLSGDYVFNIQAIETANVHADNTVKNTYLYLYDALPSQHIMPIPSWTDKTQHVDDMTTLLGYDNVDGYVTWTTPYTEDPPEKWELELSKAHITMWTNFARSGDPNKPTDSTIYTNTMWPKYNTHSQRYLNISCQMTEKSVGKRLFARSTNFWWNVLPHVAKGSNSKLNKNYNKYCARDGDCGP